MSKHWDQNAELRRNQIENGLDLTFSRVFVPYFAELISREKPKSVLEVGGGTGHLAKEIANQCATYVMLEPSRGMYEVALTTLSGTHVRVLNCPIESVITEDRFDCVMSHLCIQAVEDMSGFIRAMVNHLSKDGLIVISLPHPAFYNDYKKFFSQESFRYMVEVNDAVCFTVTLDPIRPIQDVPYYHRPISSYVTALIENGVMISGFSEVMPSADVEALYDTDWRVPRYLVLCARRAARA